NRRRQGQPHGKVMAVQPLSFGGRKNGEMSGGELGVLLAEFDRGELFHRLCRLSACSAGRRRRRWAVGSAGVATTAKNSFRASAMAPANACANIRGVRLTIH